MAKPADDCQLALGLPDAAQPHEASLRRAWREAGLRMTYEQAMRTPHIRRCLENIARSCDRWRRRPMFEAVAAVFNPVKP
jgi:hypothetical protein